VPRLVSVRIGVCCEWGIDEIMSVCLPTLHVALYRKGANIMCGILCNHSTLLRPSWEQDLGAKIQNIRMSAKNTFESLFQSLDYLILIEWRVKNSSEDHSDGVLMEGDIVSCGW
jgi:hypothetical protein